MRAWTESQWRQQKSFARSRLRALNMSGTAELLKIVEDPEDS